MPTVELDPTLTMYYEDDCFVDPWREPEVALLVHGIAESSRMWYGWMPVLSREFRVLRVDQRGFGRSTVPAEGYPWSFPNFAADLARFLDALGVRAVHLVGAKLGSTIALQFAVDHPHRVKTLSVMHGIVIGSDEGSPRAAQAERSSGLLNAIGVEGWAAATQRLRLGSDAPEEMVDWWNKQMGMTPPWIPTGILKAVAAFDLWNLLPRVQAPTLVVAPETSTKTPAATIREWQERIPGSELLVLPSDAYHIAASRPIECAQHVVGFIKRRSPG